MLGTRQFEILPAFQIQKHHEIETSASFVKSAISLLSFPMEMCELSREKIQLKSNRNNICKQTSICFGKTHYAQIHRVGEKMLEQLMAT